MGPSSDEGGAEDAVKVASRSKEDRMDVADTGQHVVKNTEGLGAVASRTSFSPKRKKSN